MNVLVINNTTGIKYQDNVTPIQLRLMNENGTVYETDDKKVTARFSNPYGFLMEKEVTERDESGNIVIRITKDEAEKVGLGKIFLEVVVSSGSEEKIFPGDGFIVFTIYKNAKTIGNSVTGITYEYFISKFDVLGEELTKIAIESLDLHQDTIDNAKKAMETATWVQKQFNSIVGKATDGPASLQLKFGAYTGTEYESPQERMRQEVMQRGKPPASGDLNDFKELNTFFVFDTGKGAMKNTPIGDLTQNSAKVFIVRNIGLSSARIEQSYTQIYTRPQWAEWRRIFQDDTWGPWFQLATIDRVQASKVTSDNGQALSASYQDLNKIYLTGFYRGVDMINAPSKGWYFVEVINQGASECLQIATNFGTKRRYVRYSDANGTFNAWDEIAYTKSVQQMLDDQVKAYGLGSNPTNTLSTGTDLNTKTDSGFYRLNGDNFVNQPEAGVGFSQMLVIRGGGDTVTQVLFKYQDSKAIWVRSGNPLGANGYWRNWTKLGALEDITNYGLGVAAASGVDWNTLTKSGFYAGSTNGPSGSVFMGIHVQHGSAYAYQTVGRNGQYWTRTNENGTWSAWKRILDSGDLQSFYDIGVGDVRSKGSSDLNNITKSGWYSYTTSSLNIPSTTTGAGVVQHIAYDANSHAQIAYSVSMRVQWIRTKLINQEWTPWLQTAGSAANAQWENLTPRGGSAVYDTASPPQVLRLGDLVMLRGALKGITGRSFLALTLPGHARPQKDTAAQTNISIGGNYVARNARWNIAPNGDITMLYTSDNSFDATWWSLDGMWFTVTSS